MSPAPPRDNGKTAPPDEAGEWLQRVAGKQDKQAFAALFHSFAPRLKSYLMRQNLNRQEAEDLTQDIMLLLWSRAAAYDPKKARASTWIYTIARNRLIDYLRQKKHFVPLEDSTLEKMRSDDAPSSAENRADGATLRAAIQELPQAQRDIVEESFFAEHTHRMIAEARRIPLGTVKSRLRLALERLRMKIAKNGAVTATQLASAVARSAEQDAQKNRVQQHRTGTIKGAKS